MKTGGRWELRRSELVKPWILNPDDVCVCVCVSGLGYTDLWDRGVCLGNLICIFSPCLLLTLVPMLKLWLKTVFENTHTFFVFSKNYFNPWNFCFWCSPYESNSWFSSSPCFWQQKTGLKPLSYVFSTSKMLFQYLFHFENALVFVVYILQPVSSTIPT